MSIELFKKIINKIEKYKQINTITFSGLGEPFSDNSILQKAEYVIRKGYKLQILTNGFYLSKYMIDRLIDIKVDTIRISFHYITKDKYINLTKAGSNDYYRILNSIKYLIKNKNKTKVVITSDMFKNDIEEVNLLKKEFSEADLLEVWSPHNWANWANYRKGSKALKTCGRPLNGPLEIQVDGKVVMCCFDYNSELVLGDLKTQSVKDIFNSEMYKKIIRFHSGRDEDILCKKCDQLYSKDNSIVIYNSKFKKEDRIGRVSTTYKEMNNDL
jgi:radical SAM protein with 4Fe4S-binding SPASM domain